MALFATGQVMAADKVHVELSSTSPYMQLKNKTTGKLVDAGASIKNIYDFKAPAGSYVLTALAKDSATVSGSIEVDITDADSVGFKVLTSTTYASNKGWEMGKDYTVKVAVFSREGVQRQIVAGNSTTAGRMTFLALNGDSYTLSLVPNKEHEAESYLSLERGGTLTFGATVSGMIPKGADYQVTIPQNAEFALGTKNAHFVEFKLVEPKAVTTEGGFKHISYFLANQQVYNFRTWKKDGLTQAGYFTMDTLKTKRPELTFTEADYKMFEPKKIVHDVQHNKGYETGDIFVNINERGHLRLKTGDCFDAHAMRTWQLTDNATNNYFMEPDFHYTVVDVNGKPSTDVITIDNANTTTSPWSTIKAVGKGTAIVLVTYDAIGVDYYKVKTVKNADPEIIKTPFLGGEYWSAIWPENTAAYVVTVDDQEASLDANMVINEKYNAATMKLAGKYVDAEHDVFYYLKGEEGASYTFRPTGVAKVELAYPEIGEQMATYHGFATEGVTKNADGSYSVLLKQGRNIVRLTDAEGNMQYQVLTARECSREITNLTQTDSKEFHPGDQVQIQYEGLRHPANKLAGIYNMSAYVTYNGIPNGTSQILGKGQYTFGSAASAQAVKITIPADFTEREFVLSEGVIQVNGFGDPIGNHRFISHSAGRNANFTAMAHKTYFGELPDVVIPVTSATTAISDVQTGAHIESIHTLDGKRVSSLRSGVNIVRMSDGSVKKIICK